MQTSASQLPPSPDEAAAPPVRAFAQGTGLLLQLVGGILFLSTSCVCVFSGLWDPPISRDEMKETIEKEQDVLAALRRIAEEPGRLGTFLNVVSTSVAGLALAVFGLGLQSDKPRAAYGAAITAFLWLATLLAAGALLWIGAGTIIARFSNIIFVLGSAIILVFTIGALKQVVANPPPKGLEILPPDFEIPKSRYH